MMTCIPESNNPYDRWAVQVRAPILSDLPEDMWNRHTREDGIQKVKDIAGQVIGRVPKDICNVIHIGMEVHRSIKHAGCVFTGEIIHGGQVQGGGPALECFYLLEVKDGQLSDNGNALRERIQSDNIWL